MGMLIPWRFVRQGFVPTVADFEGVACDILGVVARERVFKAAAFVGSLRRGDIHPRSDLDLILVAYDRSLGRAQELERKFRRISLSRAIPLDSRLWSSSDARLGRHIYGSSYLDTFPTELDRFSIGLPLAECFRVPRSSVQVEMLEKLEHKLHSTRTRAGIFLARHVLDPEMVEQWLLSNWIRVVRPMRIYITLGRRMLWWLYGALQDDGKAEVISRFLAEPTFSSLHGDYRKLLDLDFRYDELLGRVVIGREHRGSYLRKVGKLLTENFQVSLRLLQNAISLTKRVATQAA